MWHSRRRENFPADTEQFFREEGGTECIRGNQIDAGRSTSRTRLESQRPYPQKQKSELKKKLAEYYAREEDGPTFLEMADDWEKNRAAKLAYKTYEAYRPHIKRAKETFGSELMKDITPDRVQAYINDLGAQGYAKDTVSRARIILNEIFEYAIVQPGSILRFNPVAPVKIPKGLVKTRREPPTQEQLDRMDAEGEIGLLAWFLLYTGLRIGEIMALRWEDVDEEQKLIHVRHSVSYEGNRPVVKEPKTEAGARDVELLDKLIEVLPAERGKGFIFGGAEPMNKMAFRRAWLKWCIAHDLAICETWEEQKNGRTYEKHKYKPAVTPHQFRHEYASILEDAQISDFKAMKALGHSSIKVTKETYTHIRQRKASRIGAQLNEYLRSEDEEKNRAV